MAEDFLDDVHTENLSIRCAPELFSTSIGMKKQAVMENSTTACFNSRSETLYIYHRIIRLCLPNNH